LGNKVLLDQSGLGVVQIAKIDPQLQEGDVVSHPQGLDSRLEQGKGNRCGQLHHFNGLGSWAHLAGFGVGDSNSFTLVVALGHGIHLVVIMNNHSFGRLIP
jgi:hypothetical protein